MTCCVDYVHSQVAKELETLARVNRMQVRNLKVRHLRDVVGVPFLGYAGLYENEKAIDYSYFNLQAACQQHFSTKNLQGVGEMTESVFFLGKINVCWGHCITDHLKFLWPFLELEKYPYLRDCKIVYSTLSRDDKLPKNYLEILRLFNIDESRLVRLDRVTRLHDCYLADECFGAQGEERWFSPEYRSVINYIGQQCVNEDCAEPSGRNIYLSRRAWRGGWVKGEFGEQYVENAFRASGFEVVHPEKTSFCELVRKLQSAKEVATTECSSSHNALFMSPGSKLILLRKMERINPYQLAINQVSDINTVYVDIWRSVGYCNPKSILRGPFFMYVSRHLAACLGVKSHFPVFEFFKYIGYLYYSKCYQVLFDLAYVSYKAIVVRWLGITRWEKGRVV